MDVDHQMLEILQGRKTQSGPMTINDFARRFGANPRIILSAARRLVDGRLAEASMVDVRGVQTLHGLLPLPTALNPEG